ncbi:hypothetical protein FOXYSP1_17873 [Fusarium oxysporum f. sp. phaseoli]
MSISTETATVAGRRLNKTCEGCRRRKIRCIPDHLHPDTATERCTRCTKLDLECIFKAPSLRRRRIRNETRINGLEQKLLEVQRLITSEHKALAVSEAPGTPASTSGLPVAPDLVTNKSPGFSSPSQESHRLSSDDDSITRHSIPPSLAEAFCIEFCTDILPHYPLILPPISPSWRTIQKDRPALFHVILATTVGSLQPNLRLSLFRDAERYILNEAIVQGHKSLDLVQAALILSSWSNPPCKFQHLTFNQFLNLAATMVIDLRSLGDQRYQVPFAESPELHTDEQKEVARTYTACYLLCSSIGITFGRPNVLRYGPWVHDCIHMLDSPSAAHIGDRRLVAWVRLQRIVEESLSLIGQDEGSQIDYLDGHTRLILQGGFERAKDWRRNLPEDIMNTSLEMYYHVVLLNFCESGLYNDHEAQDFQPPYTIHTLPTADPLTHGLPQFVDAHVKCLDIAWRVAELFLQFSPPVLRQVPTIIFTRMMYAVVIIIKLQLLNRPSSEVSFTAKEQEQEGPALAVGVVRRIVDKLESAADATRFRTPATFHAVLRRLLSRCLASCSRLHTYENEIIKPLLNLQVDELGKENTTTSALLPPKQREHTENRTLGTVPQPQHMEVIPFPDSSAPFKDVFLSEPDENAPITFWDGFTNRDDYFPMNMICISLTVEYPLPISRNIGIRTSGCNAEILAAAAFSSLALSKSLPWTTLAQLEHGTFLEDIATRSNGDILTTELWPSAAIYTIRNPHTGHNSLQKLFSVTSIQSIYGLTQVKSSRRGTETFIFVGGNSTSPGDTITGSFGAWAVDFDLLNNDFQLRKVSDMGTDSRFLNGVTAIPGISDIVLVADSANGLVGRLNITTGIFDTSAFRYPLEMDPVEGARLPIGVNGIKIRGGHLYWTNSFQASIYRIAITPNGYPAKGTRPEIVADLSNGVDFLDDFSFDFRGNIYAATNLDNSIVRIDITTKAWKTIIGGIGEMTVPGCTSVVFGHRSLEKELLYVSTSGAIATPVNGTETEGAKVVAIKLGGWI